MSETQNTSRQKIIKDSGHYVGSSIIGQGFGLVRAVLMPVFFSPTQLGVWNIMNLILSYCPHAQLGLTHGMNKLIPMMKGSGNNEEEVNIQNSVFWVNVLLSLLAFIGMFLYSYFVADAYVIPLRILAAIVFFQMLYYYHFSLLRANSRFIIVSNGIFLTSVLSTVLVITCIVIFPNPVIGGLIGSGLSTLIVLIYWVIKGAYFFPFKINLSTIKKCFFYGIPVLAIGILDSCTVSIDRMFIAVSMSKAQLGYYALGIMISGMVSLIPGSVASVLYSTMLESYAVKNDPKDVKNLLVGPMRVMWALIILLIGFSIIAVPGLIHLFIPKYIPSIPIVQMLIFGSFFMSSSHVPGMFIIAVNKQRLIIILQITAIALVSIVDWLLIYLGYGLTGVATGTICGYLVYGIGYTSIALYMATGKREEVIKYIYWQTFPFIMLLLTFVILNKLFPDSADMVNYAIWAVIKILILLTSLLFYLWIVNRDGQVINFAKTEVGKLARKFSKKKNIAIDEQQ